MPHGQIKGTVLFVFGATTRSLPRPPQFLITHNDGPQSVGLPWTSDRLEKGQLVEGIIIVLARSATPKGLRTFGNRVPRERSGLFKDTVSH